MYMEELTKTANSLDDLGGGLCLVRCEVLRVSMKTAAIFWVVIMCSLLLLSQVFQCFRGSYWLHVWFYWTIIVSHHI